MINKINFYNHLLLFSYDNRTFLNYDLIFVYWIEKKFIIISNKT